MLTTYAYAISGATLLCRKFLKPKRLRDPQILVRPYSIWSDQDKLLTHVQRNAVETEIMNITSVARFIPPWRHISRIYVFRIQDTWDICDRPSMVMSLLSVRGECRHTSLRSDRRQNRHLVTPCTTLSNLSTHPGTDLCVYIDFWRSRQPEYTSLLAPVCSLIHCSAAVSACSIPFFYSCQVGKMYIIHTADS